MKPILKTAIPVGLLALLGTTASAATLSGIGTFEGVAGIGTPNGVVGATPVGDSYVYVTTADSDAEVGLGEGGETTGSELITDAFNATAGEELSYFFNYITSDGAGFSDYAYVQLLNAADGTQAALLFTARTREDGDIVPGFDLPAIDAAVTLSPASSEIIPDETDWAELGIDSGDCFADGCGQTGWIGSNYTIVADGEYQISFGVTNWNDEDYASGLAIAGLSVGTEVIIPDDPDDPVSPPVAVVPLPATGLLFLAGLAGLGIARRKG